MRIGELLLAGVAVNSRCSRRGRGLAGGLQRVRHALEPTWIAHPKRGFLLDAG